MTFQRQFDRFLEAKGKREDPQLTAPIRIEGRIVQIPWKEEVGVYRGDRFVTSYLRGVQSEKEIPDIARIDLDELPTVN